MASLRIDIYKSEDGVFTLSNEPRYVSGNTSTRDYVKFKHPELADKSSAELKNKAYRFGKTKAYSDWVDENTQTYTPVKVGVASLDYDGRLKEWMVKRAILTALNNGVTQIEVEPLSNINKPAHERMVYIKDFIYEEN